MDTQALTTANAFEEVAARLGPCELVRGEVVTLSPGGISHSQITMTTGFLLAEWSRRTGLGRVMAGELGLIVERKPDTVRGADVAYYSYERLPKQVKGDSFSPVPPNLVVEIVGRGQGWREMVEKVGEYLRMGVDRVWIVDPRSQKVHIFRSDAEPVIVNGDDALSDEAILPGFVCKVEELFAD